MNFRRIFWPKPPAESTAINRLGFVIYWLGLAVCCVAVIGVASQTKVVTKFENDYSLLRTFHAAGDTESATRVAQRLRDNPEHQAMRESSWFGKLQYQRLKTENLFPGLAFVLFVFGLSRGILYILANR